MNMQEQIELTDAEKIFINRMLPHFLTGKSFEEAAKAVIEDDFRLYNAFCDRSYDYVSGSYNDHSGRTVRTAQRPGDLIASEMTKRVYKRLKGI